MTDLAMKIMPTEVNRFFWEAAAEEKLFIQRCPRCSFFCHPPTVCCPICLGRDLPPTQISGNGTVYSFTIIRRAFHPAFSDQIPYVVAMVELEAQRDLKLVTQIVDCSVEEVYIGMTVGVTFRRSGQFAVPCFAPRASASINRSAQ